MVVTLWTHPSPVKASALRDRLLNNGARPRYGVAAVAKRDLAAGAAIARGVGGFEVRGEGVAIAEDPGHAPVALLGGARLRRGVRAGERLRLDDLEIPESEALEAWLGTAASGRADRRSRPGRSAPPEPASAPAGTAGARRSRSAFSSAK